MVSWGDFAFQGSEVTKYDFEGARPFQGCAPILKPKLKLLVNG